MAFWDWLKMKGKKTMPVEKKTPEEGAAIYKKAKDQEKADEQYMLLRSRLEKSPFTLAPKVKVMSMEELMTETVRAIVDDPFPVKVEVRRTGHIEVYDIHVAPQDIGYVLGKAGATVAALRTLTNSIAGRGRFKTYVNVVKTYVNVVR